MLRIVAIRRKSQNHYPQKILPTHQALWCIQSQIAWCLPLWNMHYHRSFPLDRFCLFSFPFRANRDELEKVTCDNIVRVWQAKLELCSYRITGARSTMWHVSTQQRLDTATFPKLMDFKVDLLPFNEIAKFSSISWNCKNWYPQNRRNPQIAKFCTRK